MVKNIIEYKNELHIADKPLSFWIKKYPLPLHVYFAPAIQQNVRSFLGILKRYYPKSRLCFAAKACTHPLVLKIIKNEGCGADVASYNEVRCALESGMPAGKLDLNGNCKEDFLIEDAIKKGMNIIADSFEEFAGIAKIADKMNKRPKILLRVSGYSLEAVTDDSVFTAGIWTKFGANIAEIPEFIRTLGRYPSVELVGFHTHIGSQICKVEPYLKVIGQMIGLSRQLVVAGGKCEAINIGGGFPVSYVDKTEWEYIVERIRKGYLKSLQGDMRDVFVWHDALAGFTDDSSERIHLDRWTGERFYTRDPKEKMLEAVFNGEVEVGGEKINTVNALKQLGEPALTIEPGRSIVEDAGVTLAKVAIVKKVAKYHNLVNLEMGITSHGESLIEKPIKKWEIANDYHIKDPRPFEAFIGGNLCFSGDMISKYKVPLQRRPKRGDIILIHNTGAYTSSLFAANSNLFPRPGRVLVDEKGKVQSIKRRDKYEEIVCKH